MILTAGGGACASGGPRAPFLVLNLLCLGEVYTWGDNDEGQLGDGTTNAIQRPRLVAALQGKKVNRVACGSAHTLAWSTSKPASAGKLPAQVGAGPQAGGVAATRTRHTSVTCSQTCSAGSNSGFWCWKQHSGTSVFTTTNSAWAPVRHLVPDLVNCAGVSSEDSHTRSGANTFLCLASSSVYVTWLKQNGQDDITMRLFKPESNVIVLPFLKTPLTRSVSRAVARLRRTCRRA